MKRWLNAPAEPTSARPVIAIAKVRLRRRLESFMSVADISLSETVAQYVTGGTNGDESLA